MDIAVVVGIVVMGLVVIPIGFMLAITVCAACVVGLNLAIGLIGNRIRREKG